MNRQFVLGDRRTRRCADLESRLYNVIPYVSLIKNKGFIKFLWYNTESGVPSEFRLHLEFVKSLFLLDGRWFKVNEL